MDREVDLCYLFLQEMRARTFFSEWNVSLFIQCIARWKIR